MEHPFRIAGIFIALHQIRNRRQRIVHLKKTVIGQLVHIVAGHRVMLIGGHAGRLVGRRDDQAVLCGRLRSSLRTFRFRAGFLCAGAGSAGTGSTGAGSASVCGAARRHPHGKCYGHSRKQAPNPFLLHFVSPQMFYSHVIFKHTAVYYNAYIISIKYAIYIFRIFLVLLSKSTY